MDWVKFWVSFVLIIIGFILLYLYLGNPDQISIPGIATWDLNKNEPPKDVLSNYAKDAIKLENVASRRAIYYLGENMTIDLRVNNPQNLVYNLSFYWINKNNESFIVWSITDNKTGEWSSWYSASVDGLWIANPVIRWNYKNYSFDSDYKINLNVFN